MDHPVILSTKSVRNWVVQLLAKTSSADQVKPENQLLHPDSIPQITFAFRETSRKERKKYQKRAAALLESVLEKPKNSIPHPFGQNVQEGS